MKKLFLTSAANQVLDAFVEYIGCPPMECTIAFIPTAWDLYEDKYFIERDRNKLLELWFPVVDINIAGKTEDWLSKELEGVDAIFVAGGNTFYLLEKSIESGFINIVRKFVDEGKWYIGSSAWSVIACPSIEYISSIDSPNKWPNLNSFDAFHLIDISILPHFDNPKFKAKIDAILQKYPDVKDRSVTLQDNQALIVDGETSKIISM